MLIMGFDGVRANYVRSEVFSCVDVRKGSGLKLLDLTTLPGCATFHVNTKNDRKGVDYMYTS
jgi:hypothetical protein